MSLTLDGTSGVTGNITGNLSGSITFPDNTSQTTAAAGFGFKNRIINGAMVIDQRNNGAVINSAGNVYTVDRFLIQGSQASKFNIGQNLGNVTPPPGFTNYLGVSSISAYSITSGDYFIVRQPVEGLNCYDLNWGTANAKTVTLSFYVYSSQTGIFSGHLTNSTSSRWYPFTYSVPSANTWTYITVTIVGDIAGSWLTNNGVGIYVGWSLGTGSANQAAANAWTASTGIGATGSVNIVSTNGATFYITGVQLEKGSTATAFDYRPYGTELQLCQRYAINFPSKGLYGAVTNGTSGEVFASLPVTMRAAPTITVPSGTQSYNVPWIGNVNATNQFLDTVSTNMIGVAFGGSSGLTIGQPIVPLYAVLVSAEL